MSIESRSRIDETNPHNDLVGKIEELNIKNNFAHVGLSVMIEHARLQGQDLTRVLNVARRSERAAETAAWVAILKEVLPPEQLNLIWNYVEQFKANFEDSNQVIQISTTIVDFESDL